MKTNLKTRRGFTLVELLVVIVIIASLAGLTAPMVIRQRKKADQTEAISNARQIGIALFEFEVEYGSYPDVDTATPVGTPPVSPIGTSPFTAPVAIANSEDAFKQLFVSGIVKSEDMFYAKIKGAVKPNGDYSTAGACLASGECGFGYLMATASDALSTGGNPSRILIASPMVSATEFDTGPFDGKAVFLKLDNSVSASRIIVGATPGKGTLREISITTATTPWEGNAPVVLTQTKL